MLSYLREKEKQEHRAKPWYRVYGLKDYKRMQNEVRLGTRTLGPDLDNETYKERVRRDSVCGLLSVLLCGLLVCLSFLPPVCQCGSFSRNNMHPSFTM